MTLLTAVEVAGWSLIQRPNSTLVVEETSSAEAIAAGAGLVEQLKGLADLHAGILTNEGFRQAGAQIFHS